MAIEPLPSDDESSGDSQQQEDSALDSMLNESSIDPLPFEVFAARNNPGRRAFDPKVPTNWPQIDGFVIDKHLGGGGFGDVYRAKSSELGGLVAIKILKPRFNDDIEVLTRFDREIHTAHQNRHPAVVQILSSGICSKAPFLGCRYLVFEFLAGGDLRSWMCEKPHSNSDRLSRAVQILIEVCDGLSAIHHSGVIHRDIKPENILLTQDRQAKIADFGLAGLLTRHPNANITRTGQFLGTLPYMAPEQIRNPRNATAQSDVYSVGVVLYELLCNLRPWQQERRDPSEEERILSNLKSLPPTPSSKSKQVDQRLQGIALRCVDPDPSFRYTDAQQLKESLEAWQRGEPDPHLAPWLIRHWHEKVVRPLRRRPIQIIATLLLLTSIGFLTYGLWQRLAYVWPHQSRYAHITNLQGIPVGITKLEGTAWKDRWYHYRFTRKGWYGSISKVEILNSNDAPFPWRQHYPELASPADRELNQFGRQHEVTWEFDDKNKTTTARNANGKMVYSQHFINNEVQYRFADDGSRASLISTSEKGPTSSLSDESSGDIGSFAVRVRPKSIQQGRAGSDAKVVVFDWSPEGYCQGAVYYNSEQEPAVDATGVYGWKAILTKDGQILEKQNLGKDHESSILNSEGWAKVRYTYTEGEVTAEEYFDTQGDRVNTAIGAKRAATYENGRLMQVELFDKDNQPTWCDQGWSSSKRKYDSRGYLLEEAYFAPNGDPTCIHSGYHKIQLHCDEEGNVTDERFLGIDGQLVYTIDGWAISRAKYEGGQQVEVSYFGTNEDPILNTNGVHMETRLYEAGLLKEVRFFGTGGRSDPVTSTEGCSIVRLGYDEQRNEVSRSNFDEHDQPVVTSEGYHRLKREYDKTRGLVKRVEYHSAPGESLTMVKDGYAVSENEYNSQGKLVRQTFFGKDRQPIEREGGYHAIEVDYDEQGRIVETRHYDTNRKLQHFEGTPIVRTTYDAFGRETSKRFFTADHQKTTHADGNHGWDAQYDPRGNQTIKCFVDTENKPFLIKNGYAKVRKTYDALGRNTSVRYFDTADQPTTDSFAGCHGWDAQYDAHGNMTIQISVDTENKPFETKYGYAKLQMTYDAQGRNTSVRYFNAAGQPTTHKSDGNHGWDAQYDHLGNQTLRCFVNTDNEPFEIKNGYAKVRTTYNPMGWKTSERYFDAADQPTTHNSDGNHGWDSKYETHENMTIQIQISVDTENKPFETKYGVTKARKTYDVLRRKTSERYFDATDQPTKLKREGNHGWDAQYDAHGNMTIQISVDTENKPFETENGYAKVRMTYDALGRQTSVRHFDATDQPTTVKPDGNHGWDAQYDLRGNRTLESYVDTDNKPFEITNGYATVKKIYDNLGRETSVRFLGVDGKLATDKSTGSLGWDAEYDLPGNHPNECLVRRTILFNQTNSVSEVRELIDEAKKTSVLTFYDTDGKQVRQPLHGALEVKVIDLGTYKVTEHLDCDGRSRCSKVVVTKNKNGLESREEYFDSEGEPVFLTGRTDVFPNYSVYQVQLDNDEATAWYSGFSEKREFDQVRIVRNDLQGTQRFTFHTQDGQQVSNEDGVGSIREWYQPDGIAERAFFDLQDNPMVTKEGFHSSKSTPTTAIKDATTKYQEFDRDYNEIRSVLANKDNEMILQSDGFAYHRRTYDQKRRIITDRYFGLDDQPAADVLGEYGIKHEYDATGTVIRSFYLGIDGTVQPSLLGISGIGFHYNDADRVIDNTYIDEAGNPIQAMNGASGFRLMYSGSLERDYYGKEKQPLQPIGLVVVKILEDSFASNAGLELGTVILEVNQKKLRSHTELREEIAALAASKSIQEYPIKFLQAGKIMEVSVPAGKLGVQTTTYYGVETLVEDKD